MSETASQVENATELWPSAVERFGVALANLCNSYAAEIRRKHAPKVDRIDEFVRTCVTNEPKILLDIQAIGLTQGFLKTECREYIQRAVAAGTVRDDGQRPAKFSITPPVVDDMAIFLDCVPAEPTILEIITESSLSRGISRRQVRVMLDDGVAQGLLMFHPGIRGRAGTCSRWSRVLK